MTKTKAGAGDHGLDSLDPAKIPARDAVHFRRIIAAQKGVTAAEDQLRKAVADARAAGESWTVIGAALGATGQAAYQRFGSRQTRRRSA